MTTYSLEHPSTSAPLWKRLFSTLYDVLILCALSLLYVAILTVAKQFFADTDVSALTPDESYQLTVEGFAVKAGLVVTLMAFYCYFWMKAGQTVGMRAWRLQVVAATRELTLSTCLLRALLGIISLSFFGLGYFWALVDKDNLALHDRLSGTKVISLPK